MSGVSSCEYSSWDKSSRYPLSGVIEVFRRAVLDDRHDGTNAVATLLLVVEPVVAEKSTSAKAEVERYILWILLMIDRRWMRSTISQRIEVKA